MFYLKHLIANVLFDYELQLAQQVSDCGTVSKSICRVDTVLCHYSQDIKCCVDKHVPLSRILNCKIELIARTSQSKPKQ